MYLTDIHTHIIPRVDDGPQTGEETIKMLKKEYEGGVRKIILTPHYRKGMFASDILIIEHLYYKIRERASKIGEEGMEIFLGCEFYRSYDMRTQLNYDKRYAMAGSNYVLVEFSARDTYMYIRNILYNLISEGYRPIIAHIERYPMLCKEFQYIVDFVELGARIQVNADSVLGRNGYKVKKFVHKLIKYDYVHFVASDCHNIIKRYPDLGKCASYIEKKWGREYAKEIFFHNPNKILKEIAINNGAKRGKNNI